MQTAVTLTRVCGWHQDGIVGGCVTPAATIQRAGSARSVREGSTDTPTDPALPPTAAHAREHTVHLEGIQTP